MRLRELDKRDAALWAFTGMDDDIYTWGEKTPIRAAIYPGGRTLEARVYGEGMKDVRLMLYDGSVPLELGMGVSLDEDTPQFRIIALERWDHWRATLERIPPGRRADGS